MGLSLVEAVRALTPHEDKAFHRALAADYKQAFFTLRTENRLDPEPLFEAARRAAVSPQACVYVGDDLRDIEAGRAAGMATLAAAWGYLGLGESVDAWGADAVLNSPADLLKWLDLA